MNAQSCDCPTQANFEVSYDSILELIQNDGTHGEKEMFRLTGWLWRMKDTTCVCHRPKIDALLQLITFAGQNAEPNRTWARRFSLSLSSNGQCDRRTETSQGLPVWAAKTHHDRGTGTNWKNKKQASTCKGRASIDYQASMNSSKDRGSLAYTDEENDSCSHDDFTTSEGQKMMQETPFCNPTARLENVETSTQGTTAGMKVDPSQAETQSPLSDDEKLWLRRFRELLEFKRVHGHCNAPRRPKETRRMYNWIYKQRTEYRKENHGKLTATQVKLMNEIEFDWAPSVGFTINEERFLKRWKELKEYCRVNGDCRVPVNYKPNPSLGRWVKKQRLHYKQNRMYLSEERIKMLNDLGFEWSLLTRRISPDEILWMKHYEDIKEFKRYHGHCHVPPLPNPALWNWVWLQRSECSKGRLPQKRKRLLAEIGFDWHCSQHPGSFGSGIALNMPMLRQKNQGYGPPIFNAVVSKPPLFRGQR